jgi:hypothetical protein
MTAQAHKELAVKNFLALKSITEMEHPPYSPDFIPNDFWPFPKIKHVLKRPRYQDTGDTKYKDLIDSCIITGIKICYQELQHYWEKCVAT